MERFWGPDFRMAVEGGPQFWIRGSRRKLQGVCTESCVSGQWVPLCLWLQIAPSRAHLCNSGPKVGTIDILSGLGSRVRDNNLMLNGSGGSRSLLAAEPRANFVAQCGWFDVRTSLQASEISRGSVLYITYHATFRGQRGLLVTDRS